MKKLKKIKKKNGIFDKKEERVKRKKGRFEKKVGRGDRRKEGNLKNDSN